MTSTGAFVQTASRSPHAEAWPGEWLSSRGGEDRWGGSFATVDDLGTKLEPGRGSGVTILSSRR
jgi:hypothetical protein